MTGQMKSSKEKDAMVREYIERVNPYKPLEPLKFDLRGYAAYLKEHSISGNNVPESVVKQFAK
ncbi:MAG: hypothetical protein Q4F55_05095 [Bacillota bacterium]|nr:hypothetical protein [Bacillota bacterium]